MSDKVDQIAQAMKAAHEAGEGYRNFDGDLAPGSVAEAYAAQARLHALHAAQGRGKLGGRKIALASKVQQELCGVDHPIAGGIFADEIMASPASVEAGHYHGLGVEFELAVKLSHDLTGPGGPYSKDMIAASIASVHPAFELIIDRGADYANLDALTMIVDNAWCAGVVLGPELPGWRALDLDELPVALYWNDDPPVAARTGLADPLGSLAWVANLVTSMGATMQASEIVIPSSVIQNRDPVPGDTMRYELAGMAGVELAVT
ncbi:MAG: 2-keto-4-pentenoate hydratase [Aestuariivirgaceae bacterium]